MHEQLPAHQPNFAHQLNFAVVQALRGQLDVCPGFIDLLDWSNYAGKRSVEHGRIFIPLANVEGAFIVIDKNHTTRYLVERVITTAPEKTGRDGPQELGMLSFHGYKFEPNKYLIHGDFHYFEMKSFLSYIGFEELSLAEEKYHTLASEDIYQRNGRGEVLFCKVASRDGDGFEQFYFDRQLK